jgi:hypothetical protein
MISAPEGVARADGISGFIVIAVIYAVLTVIGKIKGASQPRAGEPPEAGPRKPRPSRARQPARPEGGTYAPRSAPPMRSGQPGDTQREARKLEELLRVLGQAGDRESQGPLGRRGSPLPPAEEVEEKETLEVPEEVVDLETEVRRSDRQVVDFDDQAEKIIKERISAASSRNRSLNRADHLEFDERIRQVAADKTAVAKADRKQLRDAIVWREILGPPIAFRDHDSL